MLKGFCQRQIERCAIDIRRHGHTNRLIKVVRIGQLLIKKPRLDGGRVKGTIVRLGQMRSYGFGATFCYSGQVGDRLELEKLCGSDFQPGAIRPTDNL